MNIRESYDSAAKAYAEHLATELLYKPLDRHLLDRFAESMDGEGQTAELGCGPGHVAGYLHARGVEVVGIDLSPAMVEIARVLNPNVEFRVGDMTQLEIPDAGLAGIVAFYSIVHFSPSELESLFRHFRQKLMVGGLAFIAFHVGDEVVHVDELFGAPVSLDFSFHQPARVVDALRAARLDVFEQAEREPYPGAEYASRRCYLLARAT